MTEGLSDVRWGPTLLLFGQPLATSCLLHNGCLQTLQCSYPTASLIYAQAVQATKSWARQEPIGRPMHFSFLSLPSKVVDSSVTGFRSCQVHCNLIPRVATYLRCPTKYQVLQLLQHLIFGYNATYLRCGSE